MKIKTFLIFLFFILLMPFVSAHYWDFVTIGQGDSRWCQLTGCTITDLIVDTLTVYNLSVIGDVFNVTMNLVTWNITESFNVGGSLEADGINSSGNITINTGVNANPTLKYREGTIDNGFDITSQHFATNYLYFNAINLGVSTTRMRIRRLAAEIDFFANTDYGNDYNITNLDCLEIDNKVICSFDDVNVTTDTSSFLTNNTDATLNNLQVTEINSSQSKDSSLVLHLQFNNNTLDSSQYKNDGTNVGTGLTKDVGEFDGISSYVDTNYQTYQLDGSISMWAKRNGANNGKTLLKKGTGARPMFDFFLDKVQFRVYNGSEFADTRMTSDTVDGEWFHIVGTWIDDTNVNIYYNGILEHSVSLSGSIQDQAIDYFIGSSQGTTAFFNGSIDSVKVWNRALGIEEIQREYNIENKNYGHFNSIETKDFNASGESTFEGESNFNNHIHLPDSIKAYFGSADDVSLVFNGSDFLIIPEVGTPNINFDDGLLTIDTFNSRVGIGTISPTELLTIGSGAGSTAMKLDKGPGGASEIKFMRETTIDWRIYENINEELLIEATRANEPLTLQTAGTTGHILLNPTDTGNVGIGTTTPSEKLTVDGNVLVNNGNFTLNDTAWEDLRFPITALKLGAVKPPAFNGNNWTYDFDDSDVEQVYMIAQMSHSRKNGSDIDGHFHWQSIGEDTGDVVWCLEYTWANIEEVFPVSVDICAVDTGLTNGNTNQLTEHFNISGVGKQASSILKGRVYRNGTDVRDTYTGDAGLLEFDIHYQVNKLGTDEHDTED